MIIRENIIEVEPTLEKYMLKTDYINKTPEELIFFDLEHYVYKKPKCIGVLEPVFMKTISRMLLNI